MFIIEFCTSQIVNHSTTIPTQDYPFPCISDLFCNRYGWFTTPRWNFWSTEVLLGDVQSMSMSVLIRYIWTLNDTFIALIITMYRLSRCKNTHSWVEICAFDNTYGRFVDSCNTEHRNPKCSEILTFKLHIKLKVTLGRGRCTNFSNASSPQVLQQYPIKREVYNLWVETCSEAGW